MRLGRDIGEEVLVENAILVTTVTAGGTGDATEIDGRGVDRKHVGGMYESCKLVITGNANVTSDLLLTILANIQDSADNSTFADFGNELTVETVITGVTGDSTQSSFEIFLDNDLRGAKRYIRAQVTPNLTDTDDDTALIAAVFVLGGPSTYPAV